MPEFTTRKGKTIRITRAFEKKTNPSRPACQGCLGQFKNKVCGALPPCAVPPSEHTPPDLEERAQRLGTYSRFWIWVSIEPKKKKKCRKD